MKVQKFHTLSGGELHTFGVRRASSGAAFILAAAFVIASGAACSGAKNPGANGSGSSAGMYIPGTYEGSGEGYEGIITVAVTVNENKITRIEVLEHAETPGFSTAAFEEVIGAIIDFNSTDVDALSGASETSGGLLQAVNEALEKARLP
jgi:uncharacterized protein with FMN-binding domain